MPADIVAFLRDCVRQLVCQLWDVYGSVIEHMISAAKVVQLVPHPSGLYILGETAGEASAFELFPGNTTRHNLAAARSAYGQRTCNVCRGGFRIRVTPAGG